MTVSRLVLPRLSRVEAAEARARSACRAPLTFEGPPFSNGPLRLSIDTAETHRSPVLTNAVLCLHGAAIGSNYAAR